MTRYQKEIDKCSSLSFTHSNQWEEESCTHDFCDVRQEVQLSRLQSIWSKLSPANVVVLGTLYERAGGKEVDSVWYNQASTKTNRPKDGRFVKRPTLVENG